MVAAICWGWASATMVMPEDFLVGRESLMVDRTIRLKK